jgi:hypothetical protein
MITTLNPERIVLTDDSSRFAERTSILTDARRHTIADVLAAFASFPWTRANDKSVGQVDRRDASGLVGGYGAPTSLIREA